jgi:hypothetical protein
MQALGQRPTDQLRARACVTLTAPVGRHLRNQRENVCDTKALWVWN